MNLQSIKEILALKRCKTHGKAADIQVIRDRIRILNSCCDEFVRHLESEYNYLINMDIDDKFKEGRSETI